VPKTGKKHKNPNKRGGRRPSALMHRWKVKYVNHVSPIPKQGRAHVVRKQRSGRGKESSAAPSSDCGYADTGPSHSGNCVAVPVGYNALREKERLGPDVRPRRLALASRRVVVPNGRGRLQRSAGELPLPPANNDLAGESGPARASVATQGSDPAEHLLRRRGRRNGRVGRTDSRATPARYLLCLWGRGASSRSQRTSGPPRGGRTSGPSLAPPHATRRQPDTSGSWP